MYRLVKIIPTFLVMAIIVTGCILPNKYQTTVTVDKDVCQVDYRGQFIVLAVANPYGQQES